MKTILVIGGSRGIGAEIVKDLLEDHKVINLSRSYTELVHENLNSHLADIRTGELPHFERLDGMVYCPGTINLKPFSRLSPKDFLEDFEVNVLGAVRALQQYEGSLKAGDNASVVLFSTVASQVGMPFHASIAAAKSGVEGLVRSLAAEWAPGVRVNAIAPSITDTPLAQRILRSDSSRESIKARHPLKRILHPKEVAGLCVFLLSDKARSITGQVMNMDNGILGLRN